MERIFVTIGWPNHWSIPVLTKCAMNMIDGDTPISVAKLLRKDQADLFHVKPSLLSWAVYDDVESKNPFIHSENWQE